MLNKLLITFLALILIINAYGQDNSNRKRDSLHSALNSVKSNTARIDIYLELADLQIKKSGEFKADLDSAETFVNKANNLNRSVKSLKESGYILIEEARLSRERGQKQEGKVLAERAVAVLKKLNDKFLLAQAYIENAEYYNQLDIKQLPQKIKLIEQGIQCLRQSNVHVQLRAATLQFLADLYTLMPGDTKALKTLQESLNDYKSVNYPLIQGVYDLFARIYYDQKDFNNSLKYELLALETAERVKDTSMQLCEINNSLGLIYLALDEKEKAISYFLEAFKMAELNHDSHNVILLFNNITHTYVRMNKAADALKFAESIPRKYLKANGDSYDFMVPISYLNIYTALKKFREARYYCDQLITILNMDKNFDNVRYNMLTAVSTFYIESKNFPAAAKYLKINETLTNKLKNPVIISQNERLWYRLDTAMHNYQAANRHFLHFFNIHDSLFNETKSRQIQQLRVQYETEKSKNELKIKDQHITFLNESAKLQKTVLDKTTLIKNITIIAILFLFVITLLIYKQYRNKRKINNVMVQTNEMIIGKNHVITQKNAQLEGLLAEKEWLLKEVHHRVKNNLHMVICLLESQAAFLEGDALKAIEKSQNRIYTMSLIHQKLYLTGDLKSIEMAVYIPELITHLKDSAGDAQNISFRFNIDQISLDTSLAIPLALIINEAVTNSFKYAFPDNRRGEIYISLEAQDELIKLEISDNGVGIEGENIQINPVSLGMEMIRGLAKEIRGNIDIKARGGVKITIIFKGEALYYHDMMNENLLSIA